MRGKRAKILRKMLEVKGSKTLYIYNGGTRVMDQCPRKMYQMVKSAWKTFMLAKNIRLREG